MSHEGRFSLTRLFTSFATGSGAEWVMWVLVLLSIVSVAFMLERGFFYRRLQDDLDALADKLRDLLHKNDLDGARKLLEGSPSPAAMVGLTGLQEAHRGADAASEAMSGANARVRMQLERNLAFLGTVGNNAPFVGLLGTVIGIIQSFDALRMNQTSAAASRGGGDSAALLAQAQASLGATGRVMGTIAEALVATAIGLFVAIPAVAAYNFFHRRVRSILASSETISRVVLAHLRATPALAAGPTSSEKSAPKSTSKAAETVGSKSAEKPAEKTVEKPAEKSAEKPAKDTSDAEKGE